MSRVQLLTYNPRVRKGETVCVFGQGESCQLTQCRLVQTLRCHKLRPHHIQLVPRHITSTQVPYCTSYTHTYKSTPSQAHTQTGTFYTKADLHASTKDSPITASTSPPSPFPTLHFFPPLYTVLCLDRGGGGEMTREIRSLKRSTPLTEHTAGRATVQSISAYSTLDEGSPFQLCLLHVSESVLPNGFTP